MCVIVDKVFKYYGDTNQSNVPYGSPVPQHYVYNTINP